MSELRSAMALLCRTPVHPQWRFGSRGAPPGLHDAEGVLLDIGASSPWIEHEVSQDATYIALTYPATAIGLFSASADVLADAAPRAIIDSNVDVYVCLEVIEHIKAPASMLAEVSRVLHPGRRDYMSVLFLYPVRDVPHEYQRWTHPGSERSAASAGFLVVGPRPAETAIETAGLLGCFSPASPLQQSSPWVLAMAATFALPLIAALKLTCWLLTRAWTDWRGTATGIQPELRKP